jgi:bifunctional non-homologous end joining protein LigD
VEVDGRKLKLSNLDKVLYPEVGFTKGEVIDYYTRIAPTMLAHIADRGVTLRRYPNGVDETSFFEKRCASHRPDWVPVALGPGDRGGPIEYCRLDSRAALAWAANMAALEIHAPMARCDDIETPTMVVFDLDPGAPADIHDCCEVAGWIREALDGLDMDVWPKTSGSKGLQLYLPVNRPGLTHEHASSFARTVAQALERHHGDRVTSTMKKEVRGGKVFIDWSQNSRHKTTIAPYSLRARALPTVSTPVTWDEVEVCAAGDDELVFTATDVLDRIESQGDLFEGVLTTSQAIPAEA